MVWIPGGEFMMGSDRHYPEERPGHRVAVDGFWIDPHPVTNAEFATFVAATGHVTVAERAPRAEDYPGVPPERLVAGSAVFRQPPGPVDLANPGNWWFYAPGADWRHPWGPESTIAGRDDHPVVHVAYADALAYARWAGTDLPTEAQWELAARGGLEGAAFAWGEDLPPDGPPPANVWWGEFPWQNLRERPPGTTPVGAYPPNGYGLSDMAGNVWEWTRDWYQPGHAVASPCCLPRNPTGPAAAQTDPAAPAIPMRVLKGGSFLCSRNYCFRYRPAARIAEAVDTSTCHLGLRCVVDPALAGV
jgi:formylglycine-generating enzyme required for sulfatase activity